MCSVHPGVHIRMERKRPRCSRHLQIQSFQMGGRSFGCALVERSKLKPIQKELRSSTHLRWGKGGWFRAKEAGFGSHSIRKCPSLSISLRFVEFMSYFEESKRQRNLTSTLLVSISLSPVHGRAATCVSVLRREVFVIRKLYHTLRNAKMEIGNYLPSLLV